MDQHEHPDLVALMRANAGVFRTCDARAAGYSATEIRRNVRSGRWLVVRTGVLTTRDEATRRSTAHDRYVRLAVSACLVVGRPSAISHETAAYVHGITVLQPDERTPSITVPPRSLSRVPGVHVYRNTAHPGHVLERSPVDLTSAARTVIDIGRLRPFGAAVVSADSALHLGLVTKETLLDVVAECERWPGWRRGASVAEFADGRAASALESLGRVMCRSGRLPDPTPQLLIVLADGTAFHGDLGWEDRRTIAELDGRVKYTERAAYGSGDPAEVVQAERERHKLIEEEGYEIVRLTYADVVRHPERSTARIRAGFERARRRGLWTPS